MKKVLLIVGTGRSGTSWIHDVATSHYNYRRIFEPLHPVQVPAISDLSGMYLDETDTNARLRKYLESVFHGRGGDSWITWVHMGITRDTVLSRKVLQFIYNLPLVKFWAKHRVVKFIQANLMISWLANNFDYPIVFVIRDPYAVIRSQLNMGWGDDLGVYSRQRKILDSFLNDGMAEYVSSLSTVTERLAARWCIENLIAIREVKRLERTRQNIIPVTYEYISRNSNIDKLLKNLGYSDKEMRAISRRCAIREYLRSSKRKSTGSKPLSGEQRTMICDVLKKFGVTSYDDLTASFNERLIN